MGPGPSLSMRLARALLRLRGKRSADPEAYRRMLLARPPPRDAPVPRRLRLRFDVAEALVAGRPVVTVAPRGGASRRILYLHGGGYVWPLIRPHWWAVGRLVRATGAAVVVPSYPLAPEADHRDGLAFVERLWEGLLAEAAPGDLWLAGDSAGGGLALGLALGLRDRGKAGPAGLLLFAPWLDLLVEDPEARAVEPLDPMLSVEGLRAAGALWARGGEPSDPRLSPLRADLRGLPPILLLQGTHDLFIADARRFAGRVRAAGGRIDLVEYPGAIHVFQMAVWTPEARDAFRRVGWIFSPGG